jgi:hypothetical protein
MMLVLIFSHQELGAALRKSVKEKRVTGEIMAESRARKYCHPSRVFINVYIQSREVNNGKEGWECKWCNNVFAPRNASRAHKHVLKIKIGNIHPCKAVIPKIYLKRYQELHDANTWRASAKKHLSKSIEESVVIHQESAVGNPLQKRGGIGGVSIPPYYVPPLTSAVSSFSFAGGANTTNSSFMSVA